MTATFNKDDILELVKLAKKNALLEYTKALDAHREICRKELRRFFLWRITPSICPTVMYLKSVVYLLKDMETLIKRPDTQTIHVNQDELGIILSWSGANASPSDSATGK